MYKIKEFSKITKTSMRTLRYYDEIDLFKPEYVDFYSGYRYYNDNQIGIMRKINTLKKFDLSLEEIKNYLNMNDKQILVEKRKRLEKVVKEMDEFLKEEEKINYKIIKANYDKYLELNGLLRSRCAMALEIKDNNADYYYIEENGKIIDDFVIYKEEKILALNALRLSDPILLKEVFHKISELYDEVYVILPIEKEELIKNLKENYNGTSEVVTQGGYSYQKIKIKEKSL